MATGNSFIKIKTALKRNLLMFRHPNFIVLRLSVFIKSEFLNYILKVCTSINKSFSDTVLDPVEMRTSLAACAVARRVSVSSPK